MKQYDLNKDRLHTLPYLIDLIAVGIQPYQPYQGYHLLTYLKQDLNGNGRLLEGTRSSNSPLSNIFFSFFYIGIQPTMLHPIKTAVHN